MLYYIAALSRNPYVNYEKIGEASLFINVTLLITLSTFELDCRQVVYLTFTSGRAYVVSGVNRTEIFLRTPRENLLKKERILTFKRNTYGKVGNYIFFILGDRSLNQTGT